MGEAGYQPGSCHAAVRCRLHLNLNLLHHNLSPNGACPCTPVKHRRHIGSKLLIIFEWARRGDSRSRQPPSNDLQMHKSTVCLYTMDTRCTSNAKNAGFRIRVDDALRAEFIEACRSRDITAAQVLRDYMRTYVQSIKSPPTPSPKPMQVLVRTSSAHGQNKTNDSR